LEDKLGGNDFTVLGFLSNDFGNQGGSEGQIDTCVDKYMLTFKQFAIGHVRDVDGAGPEEPQPVWKWLLSQPDPGPVAGLDPTWNFHKYLISRDGKLVKHWASGTYPGDDPNNPNDSFDTNEIVMAIKAEIAK
jgi:glutathione peroxidase